MSEFAQTLAITPSPVPSENTAIVQITPEVEDLMIEQWLQIKTQKSSQTKAAYEMVMRYFRKLLQDRGLDVFSDLRAVAIAANDYAHTSYDRRGRVREGQLSEGTINQRLAILSSFYTFCHKWEPRIDNPISLCEREMRHTHDAAPHLTHTEIEAILKAMPRKTVKDQRDYALLLLAFTTGRRAAELVALVWGDLQVTGKTLKVTWRHCKGNKTMQDILGEGTRNALVDYLTACYGSLHLDNDTPIFISLSHNHRGKAMTTQAVADICDKYLGTRKIHTTRHSFAYNSEVAGASLSEIGERLGHQSLKTTSDYLKRLHSAENKHIKKLESLYGVD
jgi:site-specific recombinase XerD